MGHGNTSCDPHLHLSHQATKRSTTSREASAAGRLRPNSVIGKVLLKGMSREISPLGLGAEPFLCLGIQPNCLNVHSRFESGLPQAESLISFRRVKRWNVSSSLWFHTLVATAPSVSETSSLTVIHFMSRLWSPRGDHNDG